MDDARRIGAWGERQAASYLRSRGWRILARNWRFHHKEIDLVVQRDGVVAFVEVKTRAEDAWAHPLAGIGRAKRRDLGIAARGWVAARGRVGESYRFDAITVIRGRDGSRLEHVEEAWRL